MESNSFLAEELSEKLDKEIEESGKAKEACGPEMETAAAQIKKSYALRDRMIEEQEELLKVFSDKSQPKEKREQTERRITNLNRKIRMVSRHAEHYREYLDFCLGKRERVSRDTITFLKRDGSAELGNLIVLKDLQDEFEEALVLNEKLKIKKEIRKKKKEIDANIEEKDSGEWNVIDVKEEKKGLVDEVKALEEKMRSMSYVKMPMDTFYDMLIKNNYRKTQKNCELLEKLEKDGKLRDEKNAAKVNRFVKDYKLVSSSGSGRTSAYFSDPLGLIKNPEFLNLATGFKPTDATPEPIKEEIVNKGLRPLLNELLSITPEKINAMKLPAEPDFESPEYQKNKILLKLGFDLGIFLNHLKEWNVSVSDDEYARLQAFGTVAQELYGKYDDYEKMNSDTATIIINDKRIADKIPELFETVFRLETGDQDIKAFREKYSKSALGYSKRALEGTKARKLDMPQSMSQFTIELVNAFVAKLYKDQALNDDKILDEYQEKYEKEKAKLGSKLEEEIKKVKIISPDYGENEAKIRLIAKKHNEMQGRFFTEEQEVRWKKRFGNNSEGGDIRSFKELMRPIEQDANGTYGKQAMRNKYLNDRDFEDYISGDEKSRNRVLYRIGKKVANIKIDPEMFNEEYLNAHYAQMYDDIRVLHGFLNIYAEYPDFFESDAFTEEERDAIRRNHVYDQTGTMFVQLSAFFINRYGIEDNGKELFVRPDLKTNEEKGEFLRNHINGVNETITAYITDPAEGLEACQNKLKAYDALFKEKPDEMRRASAVFTAATAKLKKLRRRLATIENEISEMPASARKEKMLADLPQVKDDIRKEIADAEKEAALTKEIRDIVFGFKEGELSPEAKAYFDKEGKEPVLHREVNRSADIVDGEDPDDEQETESLFIGEESMHREKKAEPPLPQYSVDTHVTTADYAQQDFHNCWCVAGATLFNKFTGQKTMDQKDVRNFSPTDEEIKSFEEIDKTGVGLSKEEYDLHVNDMRTYMGEGKQEVGSIYETADVFIKKNRDMAVRRMSIYLPSLKKNMGNKVFAEKSEEEKEKDAILYHAQKKAFLDQLNEVLSTGNPVAILDGHDEHYKTITKIEGENITLLESSGLKEEVKHIDEVLKRNDNATTIELTWFSKLKKPEEELAEQPNLKYSEEEGYGLKQYDLENASNPMWREGISVSVTDEKLGIMKSSYIPLKESPLKAVKAKEEKEKKEEHAVKQPQTWEETFDDEASDDIHQMDIEGEIEGLDIDGLEEMDEAKEAPFYFEADTDEITIEIETEEERAERLLKVQQARLKELDERQEKPGLKIPQAVKAQALKENGRKGSFSKKFVAASADLKQSIEKFAYEDPEDINFFKAMGIKSIVEFIYVDGIPLADYVRRNYEYKGNDPEVLKNYAAFFAGSMKEPLVFFCPKVENGKLTYKPRFFQMESEIKNENDRISVVGFRRRGVFAEQELRGNIPVYTAVKASRAYRERYNADTFGFDGLEGIADRINTAKKGSNEKYIQFTKLFDNYYTAVERFAYTEVPRKDYQRLYTYAHHATLYARDYMRGKKPTEARHQIALDAIRVLNMQTDMLEHALEKGCLKLENSKCTIAELFKEEKEDQKKKKTK